MGDNFYEVWLYSRRAAARVRFLHGGSQSVVLPEIFSGKSINLEPLRKPRKKSSARILSFRHKVDDRTTHQPLHQPLLQGFERERERDTRKKTVHKHKHKKTL